MPIPSLISSRVTPSLRTECRKNWHNGIKHILLRSAGAVLHSVHGQSWAAETTSRSLHCLLSIRPLLPDLSGGREELSNVSESSSASSSKLSLLSRPPVVAELHCTLRPPATNSKTIPPPPIYACVPWRLSCEVPLLFLFPPAPCT